MCLKNSHLLEWFCMCQPGRGLRLPLSLWALLLWWLPPWRRTEAQWASVDLERRQVFCLFLQGKAHWGQRELELFFSFLHSLLLHPSAFPQVLTCGSTLVSEKASPVLTLATANDAAEWQQPCFELITLFVRSKVCSWEETAEHRGTGPEKPMLVLPLNACSAFRAVWVRAFMSPHPTLTQTCWLKWPFAWNDYLRELSHFWGWCRPEKQGSQACFQRSETGGPLFWTNGNDCMRPFGKWCLLVCVAGLTILYITFFGKVSLMLMKIKFCHHVFALCFAKWAY